jgi:hypothetical protein
MHPRILIHFTALFFLFSSTVTAGTIFTWTDADGVKRYSNSQPPEDADNVQTIEEIQYEQRGDDQSRREFDRMAEESGEDADRHFEEQARKKEQAAEAQRQRQLEKKSQEDTEKRANLQKQIEEIQARGLGPNFSAGQRDHLIRQVQEKIDALENSADR